MARLWCMPNRVNVALTDDTAAALAAFQARTGWRVTASVNYALRLMNTVEHTIRTGGKVVLRDQHGQEEVIRFL